MAYDLPTADEIRTRFREFATVDDNRIDPVISEAARYVDDSWKEEDYKPAVQFLVAHMLILEGVLSSNNSAAASLANIQAGRAISSFSLGDASVTFEKSGDSAGGTSNDILQLSATQYGIRFRSLRMKNRSGVRVLNR